jgi:hypothetical protein
MIPQSLPEDLIEYDAILPERPLSVVWHLKAQPRGDDGATRPSLVFIVFPEEFECASRDSCCLLFQATCGFAANGKLGPAQGGMAGRVTDPPAARSARSDAGSSAGSDARGRASSIGPVLFGRLGGWITARCPRDLDPVMRRAGGVWEPGTRQWLIERRRIGPVIGSWSARSIRCSGRLAFAWIDLRLGADARKARSLLAPGGHGGGNSPTGTLCTCGTLCTGTALGIDRPAPYIRVAMAWITKGRIAAYDYRPKQPPRKKRTVACVFRRKAANDSDAFRPLIPTQAGPPIPMKVATH